jgi:hypothetical protein
MVLSFDNWLEVDRRATEVGAQALRASVLGVAVMFVYDDNFGFWDIGGPEERAFFDYVQRRSVSIACERCERPVRLVPPKVLCACCDSALEYGAPASMSEYGSQETLLDPASPP